MIVGRPAQAMAVQFADRPPQCLPNAKPRTQRHQWLPLRELRLA